MSTATASPLPTRLNPTPSPQPQTSPLSTRARASPTSSPQQHSPGSPRAGSSHALDIESVLKSYGGDVRRALESVVAERNNLQSQNSQLWKLIEKQRTQTAHFAADNDRLRAERERANNRLVAAGLDPIIPLAKQRIPNSVSAVGLGLRAETNPIPQMRRHNSDREDNISPRLGSLQVPGRSAASSSPSSPADEIPTLGTNSTQKPTIGSVNGLLPSPMTEKKLRHESRMVFPPEVSSYMSLADENGKEPVTMPASSSSNTLSPSSQYSQSPGVTTRPETSGVVPPPSSQTLAITTEMPELEATTRQSTPSPLPTRSSSVNSYRTQEFPPPEYTQARTSKDIFPPAHDTVSPRASQDTNTPRASMDPRGSFDNGSIISNLNEKRRPLPRLTAQLLPHARLSIPASSVYPNQSGRDVLCFIVTVTVRPPNAQPITWNVAKLFSAFIDLDAKIKAKAGKNTKEWKKMVAVLPESRAWKDFAPSKIDQRKATLEAYLQSLLVAPISDKSDLCEFLSTDPVQPKLREGRKEGYLTKKGKNFGGWKTRFFVLDGPQMEYYETRGGAHLGSIVVTNAQIGRQNRPSDSNDDRDFRHAFLIIETPKRGTTNRHVLCAESDAERDNWIEMLVRHVDPEQPLPSTSHAPLQSAAGPVPDLKRKSSMSRKLSKDVVVTAAQPIASLADAGSKLSGAPSPSLFNSMETRKAQAQAQAENGKSAAQLSLSIPSQAQGCSVSTNQVDSPASPAQNSPTSYKASPPPQPYPQTMVTSPSLDSLSSSPPGASSLDLGQSSRSVKRQSVMPVPSRQSFSPAYLSKLSQDGMSAPPGYTMPQEKDRDRKAKSGRFWSPFSTKAPEKISKPVFGVPLSDSISIATVANLPAIVFRCIEYLEAKRAEDEEGIYRLSGSSAVIKGLKDRFNQEGDVNLLRLDEHWDPHAIAGLLKTFLRELPTSLLTHELHVRFLSVMDLIDSSARVAELARLVADLPPPNYALLRALTAHLILIVKNAPVNKMTLRNIGIVFSPTLGIPAGIFSELVSHFGRIFDDDPDEDEEDEEVSVVRGENGNEVARLESGNQLDMLRELEGEETIKRKRNSMLYQAGGADALLGLGGRSLDPATEDSSSETTDDIDLDLDSEDPSVNSTDNLSSISDPNTTPQANIPSEFLSQNTPKAEHHVVYPSAAVVRKAKAAAAAAERGLGVQTSNDYEGGRSGLGTDGSSGRNLGGHSPGLPISPRPEFRDLGAEL